MFGSTFKELESKLRRFGFTINKKKTSDGAIEKITFRHTEQLFAGEKQSLFKDDDAS
jgi:hypothetical protein